MTGTVYKRGKTWSARLDTGKDASGKRQQPSRGGFKTKAAAQAWLRETITAVEHGTHISATTATLCEWLNEWLNQRRPNIAPNTYDGYRLIIAARIVPVLGAVKLRDLRPTAVASFYAGLLKSGRSNKTVLNTHRCLSQSLKSAVRLGLVSINVCDRVEAPRPKRYVASIPTAEELARILAAADETHSGALVRFATLTGARQGEVFAARWTDIGFDHQVWHVQGTKTRGSLRTIELGDDALEVLRAHRRRQRERGLIFGAPAIFAGDDALIFSSEVGTPINRHNFARRDWKRIIDAAGVRQYRFHDLRHFHASALIGLGTPVTVVAARLGHSRVSTTTDTYSHLLPRQGEIAASLLEDLIAGRKHLASS